MLTEQKTFNGEFIHYGLGWILGVSPFEGLPQLLDAIWHGKVQQGPSCAILVLPEEEIGVVILSNFGGLGEEITSTCHSMDRPLIQNSFFW